MHYVTMLHRYFLLENYQHFKVLIRGGMRNMRSFVQIGACRQLWPPKYSVCLIGTERNSVQVFLAKQNSFVRYFSPYKIPLFRYFSPHKIALFKFVPFYRIVLFRYLSFTQNSFVQVFIVTGTQNSFVQVFIVTQISFDQVFLFTFISQSRVGGINISHKSMKQKRLSLSVSF